MPKFPPIKCVVVESDQEVDPVAWDQAINILCHLAIKEYFARHPEHSALNPSPFPKDSPSQSPSRPATPPKTDKPEGRLVDVAAPSEYLSLPKATIYTPTSDQSEQTKSKPATGNAPDIASVLTRLLNSTERQSFKLVVQGGKLIELSPIDSQAEDRCSEMQPGWVSLRTASKRLAHSYHWMSRHWRELGLRPRKMGCVLFFREEDIAALIERQRPMGRGPGRPRKVVGIIR